MTGGRLTAGVVRIGQTVRRPGSPSSAFIAALLNHLHAKGFDACPRHLGRDELDRDTLSFIPGDVPAKWRYFDDSQVRRAAQLLRQMHDATRDFGLLGEPDQVVCHHDPGPNNVVFRAGEPIAFIDFDLAAPGQPLEDLGYMSWSWCISSRLDRSPVTEQARQVRVLADAYGLSNDERSVLPSFILQRLQRNAVFWNKIQHDARTAAAQRARAAEVLAWTAQEFTYFGNHRASFDLALAS